MNTQLNRLLLRVGPVVAVTVLVCVAFAGSQELSAADKARLKKLDAGPQKIDISKYPADEKPAYATFEKKCVKCHNLSRAINTTFVLPGEWERYIKRMMFKPDSKVTEADGKEIYRFLVYDASVRKADSLRVHLAKLPTEDREAQLAKIRAINPSFKAEK
jgi:hypothetical protein